MANAPAAASSASSMSPRRPASVASTRPRWPRKTASSTTEASVEEGPHLDRCAGPGLLEQFPGDGECPVEVAGLDQEQAGEVLLAVDERPVGQQHPSVVVAQKMVDKTQERSRTFLDKHLLPRIGDEPLVYIDVPRVLEVKAGLAKDGVPDYTSARTLKLLRQVLHFAVLSGVLTSNPADVLRAKGMLPPQGRKKDIRPLLPSEVEAIRAAMLARHTPHAVRDATLVSVLAYAGLRPGEA